MMLTRFARRRSMRAKIPGIILRERLSCSAGSTRQVRGRASFVLPIRSVAERMVEKSLHVLFVWMVVRQSLREELRKVQAGVLMSERQRNPGIGCTYTNPWLAGLED
jgi:hypothetical protein